MDALTPKRCICGQIIVFVKDSVTDAVHPLDVGSAPHIYRLEWRPEGPRAAKQETLGLPIGPESSSAPMLVSHFRTCSKVREFASNRKQIEGGPGV